MSAGDIACNKYFEKSMRIEISNKNKVINELQQDLNANQKELSSKTKKIVQMQNMLSSMSNEISNKNKVIDELKISSKLQSENRTDKMYLQIEEYKNEKHQIQSNYNILQRSYDQIKTQYNTLQFTTSKQQQEYNLRQSRIELNYKNKIQNIQQIHNNEIIQYKNKIEEIKQQSYLNNNKETENIKNSLKELKETHERIENDLNTQIEDLKDQMNKREKEKQQIIQELNQLSDNYKKYAENEINKLKLKLKRYANCDVEIILCIQVDDDYIRNKPPPKKPAPPKPLINITDITDNNSELSLLSPKSPISQQLTLRHIKSNPEFWSTDHSNPNGSHHKTYLSQGSMPSIDSNDTNDTCTSNDDTSTSDNNDNDDDTKQQPQQPQQHIIISESNANANANGYVSRRRPNVSKSVSSLPNVSSTLSSLSNVSSKPRTPTFYVVRKNISNINSNNNEYNAIIAQRYRKNNKPSHKLSHKPSHKYTDNALGFIKNGVVSMWGSTPKTAQTPKPKTMHPRPRYLSSANSVSGFPNTSWNGIKRNKRTHSNVSSISSYGDLFSDNLSIGSSTGGYENKNKNGTASSVKLAPHDALSNKSLELQRKMLMQANTRLAEDLKNEKKNLMIVKEKAHRKYKQLQIQMQAEQRQWKLKERQFQQKLDKNIKQLKQNEYNMNELQNELQSLNTNTNTNTNTNVNNITQQQLILKIQSLETNNKSLITQCDKYRRELTRLKQTVLSCDETMKQQQKQILTLNTKVSDLRKLNGFGGGSSEQLLQKQIRLLKSQRRMLIQELKDLRQQNEKLKNIIVSGSASGSALHNYNNTTTQ